MAVDIPGLISIIVFYLLILLVGVFAARKTGLRIRNLSRQDVVLAGRSIGLFVGSFTLTGKECRGLTYNTLYGYLYCDGDDVDPG